MAVNIEHFLSQKYDRYELQEVLRTEELYNDINNIHLKSYLPFYIRNLIVCLALCIEKRIVILMQMKAEN